MKKITTLLGLLLILVVFARAQKHDYPDAWGKAGFNLTDNQSASVQVVHSIRTFEFSPVEVEGKIMQNIKLPGTFLPNEEGMPNLPGNGRYIAMPNGATPHFRIVSQRVETFHNIDIAPAPKIPTDLEPDYPLIKNPEVYSKNTFYPESPVQLSDIQQIRGVDVVILGITPFQYNPVTKNLVVYRDLKVEIDFEGGNGVFGDPAFRSSWWDPIMEDNILNYASLPAIDYHKRLQSHINTKGLKDNECEYIIITPTGSSFQSWADTVRKFRSEQGILAKVFTLDDVGGNTVSAIESFIDNAYNTWSIKPVACVLLADYGSDATKNIISPLLTHPASYPNFASDNQYADVNGDKLPDVVFSRIVANDANQLQVLITKFLENERNPSVDPLVYDKPISALGWQTVRWFQLCSEIVGGYFRNVWNKHPRRINAIYEGTPGSTWSTASNTSSITSYFGPGGLGYIPATPSELGGWSGGNAAKITNAIDSGAFMLLHRDHGEYTGWGEPAYSNSNISQLTNTVLPFVFSINCQTGAYHRSSECFGEKFVRHTKNGHNAGALGIVCPTEVSYSFVNDTFVWGMFDNLFPDFMPEYGTTPPSRGVLPAFGNAAGKYFLKQSSWPSNPGDKTVTFNLFHMLGEAFQVVYCTIPQQLTVNHSPIIEYGSTEFPVQANEGALIALTVNSEIIATATGIAGGPVIIPIPVLSVGTQVLITVTKQNFFRYTGMASVNSTQLVANFTANHTAMCIGANADFSDLSGGNPESWQWVFNGGVPSTSTLQNPTGIVYSTAGDYDVTLTIQKTGADPVSTTKTAYIHVFDYPEAAFTTTINCPGEESTFTDNSNPHGSTISSWEWTFGDPASGEADTSYLQNPSHTYALPGTYLVSLTVFNAIGCTDLHTMEIVVPDIPGKAADPTGPIQICQGQSSPEYSTTGSTDATSYAWAVTPVEAGTVSGDEASVILEVSPGYTGTLSLQVSGVNACGKGEISNAFDVSVLATPVAPDQPAGADSVNLNKVSTSEFTIPEVPGATAYAWGILPTEAGTISGTGLNGTVIWTPTFRGVAGISVSATNQDCPGPVSEVKEVTVYAPVGIGENDKFHYEVYPNPTSGKINLDLSFEQNAIISITIYNTIGNIVYRDQHVNIPGKLHRVIDLSALPGGIYLLKLENEHISNSTRIVIGK